MKDLESGVGTENVKNEELFAVVKEEVGFGCLI